MTAHDTLDTHHTCDSRAPLTHSRTDGRTHTRDTPHTHHPRAAKSNSANDVIDDGGHYVDATRRRQHTA